MRVPLKSPTEGKSYIRVTTKRFDGAPVALPGEVIPITVANLKSDTDVVIYLDDQPASRGRASGEGSWTLELRAPREFGLHSITVRTAGDEKAVIDGTMFLVKHYDDFKQEKPPRQ